MYSNVRNPIKDFIQAAELLNRKGAQNMEVKEAENYLLGFEKSIDCWTVLPKIINDRNIDTKTQLQAAIMLKKKLQFDFYQLPKEDYNHVGEMIISSQ
jgi:hypothetical protein